MTLSIHVSSFQKQRYVDNGRLTRHGYWEIYHNPIITDVVSLSLDGTRREPYFYATMAI